MSYRENINCWYMEEIFFSNETTCKELIDKEVIALGFDKEIDLNEAIGKGININEFIGEKCKFKDDIELFTKVKSSDYFKYVAYYEDKNSIINKVNYVGKVVGNFDTHYKHDPELGHTLPIKWINKNTHTLNNRTYTDVLYEIDKEDINEYLEYINLENDDKLIEELQNTKSNIYYIMNEFYGNKYSEIDDENIIISINNKRILDILKLIKKDDYIIFINREDLLEDSTYIEYGSICKVKNDFCKELIKNESLDYILNVEYIRDTMENTENYSALITFKKLKHENLLGRNVFNKQLNKILYGPPGTGKTYNTYNETLKLYNSIWYTEKCNNEQDNRVKIKKGIKYLLANQNLRFCTFHQSYGYEEFIEGIKSDGNGSFKVEDGILKEIAIDALYEGLKLDIKLDYEVEKDSLSEAESRNRKKQLVLKHIHNKDSFQFKEVNNYILVIDEINRGNISKIFGELITLLEEDKRLSKENEILVKLPYSKEIFCLPPNLYIIGTMNTSDKSIALMDVALRRRFCFKEMMPNHNLLKTVENIKLDKMLEIINKRIEFLYDRDYMIGHAYLINVKDVRDISDVFKDKIIPLLQEYFYDDWEKIGLILGGIGKNEKDDYIVYKREIQSSDLFKDSTKYKNKIKYYIKENISETELKSIYE